MNFKYCAYVLLCILVCWLIVYKTAEAGIVDWFFGETTPIVIVESPKTLDSEIDRLSQKYEISSSTVRAVSGCESSMYGSAINHNRLPDGSIWSSDFGPLQINDYYHEAVMTKMGLDIHNEFDSLEYGIKLMSEQGLQPWSASKTCWSKLI
jgi:hypothetical protein